MDKRTYVVFHDGKYTTVRTNGFRPKNAVCEAANVDIEVQDIIDDIDQMTGEIIGKKAVICPKKCAEKEAAKLAAEEAEKNRLQQRADKIAALKENGSQEVKDLLELLGL